MSDLVPLPSLWPHQQAAVEAIVDAFQRVNLVILEAPVGCLAGDTMIGIRRRGNSLRFRLDDLVHRFNGGQIQLGRRRHWDAAAPTFVQVAKDGIRRLGTLEAAYESGIKETFTLTTKEGRSIRATATHPFLTVDGWAELGELRPGDAIQVALRGWVGPGIKTIGTEIVETITKYGEEPTYDLTMASEPHNFIANGFVVHNSGKTYIAEAVRRQIAPRDKSVYVCSSIVLQNQVVNDPPFSHARLLKGRANYTPRTNDRQRAARIRALKVSCEDCTWQGKRDKKNRLVTTHDCDWCDERLACPYTVARQEALNARLAILNTDYWLTESNHVGNFSGRYLAIVDEADLIDDKVTSHSEIFISKYRLDKLGLTPPSGKVTGNRTTKTWLEWIDGELIPSIAGALLVVNRELAVMDDADEEGLAVDPVARMKAIKEKSYLTGLDGQIRGMKSDLLRGKNAGWIRVGDSDSEVAWRPLWPYRKAADTLWRHATKWLLMSGTIISAEELQERMGWSHARGGPSYEAVSVESTIPVDNRPIFYLPVAQMSRKSEEEDYERMGLATRRIVQYRHPEDRVLVHTVSRAMSERMAAALEGLGRKVVTYRYAKEAPEAIEAYKATPRAILVAQSQERGLDLPGELCRCQIITKIPYRSLGDAHTSSRIRPPGDDEGDYEGGQRWYCADEETEIMTRRGWRRQDQLVEGEDVLTLNPESRQSEWNTLEKVNLFHPDEPIEMISMEGLQHSSLTTPDHRWFIRYRSYLESKRKERWEWRTTESLSGSCSIPTALPYSDFPTETTVSDALVELVAWWWTEGSLSITHPNSWRAQISQSHWVNQDYVARIRTCCEKLFGPSTRGVGDGYGWSQYVHERTGVTYFNLRTRAARMLNDIAPNRIVDPRFLLQLTASQIHLFIETSIDADGSRTNGQIVITQKEEERLRAFEFACVLAGIPTSTRWVDSAGIWNTCLLRRGSGFTSPRNTATKNQTMEVSRVLHSGAIWCPTTANGTWLARRRGTVYYTGNTLEALRRLVQMTGRGVRGINDHAVTYILDSSFYNRLWRDVEWYAPRWWKDSIQWTPPSDLLQMTGVIPGWKE